MPRDNVKLPVKWRIEEVKGWLDLLNELDTIHGSVWKLASKDVERELSSLLQKLSVGGAPGPSPVWTAIKVVMRFGTPGSLEESAFMIDSQSTVTD